MADNLHLQSGDRSPLQVRSQMGEGRSFCNYPYALSRTIVVEYPPVQAAAELVKEIKIQLAKVRVHVERIVTMALLETLREKREEILQIAAKHGALNVRVFGSVVRGEETPESDIDFLIDYDLDKITPWFPGGLLMDLQDLLGRKVDVLTEQGISPHIRERVLAEAMPL